MNDCRHDLFLLLTISVLSFCGCSAPRSQFVLLPSPDGRIGTVTVASKSGEATLFNVYESTDLSCPEDRPAAPKILTEEAVKNIFRDAMSAHPPVPVKYILYFEPSSTKLTQESEQLMRQIVDDIKKAGSTDINISGHADKSGSRDINIKISRERAMVVAKLLTGMGIAPASLEVASYGMELPLVDTPEGVPEPRVTNLSSSPL